MEQDWERVVIKKREKKMDNKKVIFPKINNLEMEDIVVPKKTDFKFKQTMQQARIAKKMTQKELAHKMGIRQSEIVSYENGKKVPTNETVSKLGVTLGCKLPRIK